MKAHFIGIGGISMSALCNILHERGAIVSGSDCTDSAIIQSLRKKNIDVNIGHSRRDFSDCDLVVYTTAVGQDNPELAAAKGSKAAIVERAELLGLLAREFECTIAVSGSHGKTTTSAMLAHMLLDKKATVHIGGNLEKLNGNFHIGADSKFFVTEACEYRRSFLNILPNIAVVLNIDGDHLDYFKDIEDVKSAFSAFIDNVASDGCIIVSSQDDVAVELVKNSGKKYIKTGLCEDDNYSARNITFDENACAEFDLYIDEKFNIRLKNSVPGRHNIFNALASVAAAHIAGVELQVISSALSEFKGADRRWQQKGAVNGAAVYLDYAHHPKELQATIETAKCLKHERLILAFQPHTYTRTNKLWKEFVETLSQGDIIFLCPIYPAREKPLPYVTSENLTQDIYRRNRMTFYCRNFKELAYRLKRTAQKGDIILILGAGDIEKAVEEILK